MSAAAVTATEAFDPRAKPIEWPEELLPTGTVTSSETKFIALTAIAVSFLTSIPYFVGWWTSSAERVFSGALQHSADSNNYLAYARQAQSGQWLFHNPMTGEPHANVFFNIEWLAIGKLAWLMHISLPAAMNVLRVASIAFMCYGVYWLSSHFLHSRFMRRAALVAIVASGGFGWVGAVHLLHLKIDSSYFIDLSNGNLFPFYWALKLPHFLISESFMVLGVCCFHRAETRDSTGHYWAAGLLYLVAGSCRPYDMLYAMATTTLYLGWERFRKGSQIKLRRFIPLLICAPLLGYYYWIFKINPVFKWWSLPGRPAPSPWLLILGFGLTSIGLITTVSKLGRRAFNHAMVFPVCALLTAILLTYSHHFFHFAFQFATNILIWAVIIIFIPAEQFVLQFRKQNRWGRILLTGALLLNTFTPLALTAHAVMLAKNQDFQIDANLLAAYTWLNDHSQSDQLVLADYENSNQLPQYAHNRMFCGYDNAVNFAEKSTAVDLFFSQSATDEFRKQLLKQNAIQFVLIAKSEEPQLRRFVETGFATEIFRNQSAVIFYAALAGK